LASFQSPTIARRFIFILFWLTICLSPPVVHAQTCAALQKALQAAGTGQGEAASGLRRQLSAIRALERQRRCSSTGQGGLFNACRDLASKRANVEKQIARFSGTSGGRAEAIRAQMRSMGCFQRKPGREAAKARQATAHSAPSHSSMPTMLYCVRPSDGYYFPAPNSQFVGTDQVENTLDRCRFICESPEMEVYVLNDSSLETQDMISMTTGKPYKDLPTAFDYRDADSFKACNFARYYERARLLRARAATVASMKDVVIPLPTQRPSLAADMSSTTPSDLEAVSSIGPAPASRPVRVILPGGDQVTN